MSRSVHKNINPIPKHAASPLASPKQKKGTPCVKEIFRPIIQGAGSSALPVTYSQVMACAEQSNCQASSKNRPRSTCPRVSCASRSKSVYILRTQRAITSIASHLQFGDIPIFDLRVWWVVRPRDVHSFNYSTAITESTRHNPSINDIR
jgi:hypothetical protein